MNEISKFSKYKVQYIKNQLYVYFYTLVMNNLKMQLRKHSINSNIKKNEIRRKEYIRQKRYKHVH